MTIKELISGLTINWLATSIPFLLTAIWSYFARAERSWTDLSAYAIVVFAALLYIFSAIFGPPVRSRTFTIEDAEKRLRSLADEATYDVALLGRGEHDISFKVTTGGVPVKIDISDKRSFAAVRMTAIYTVPEALQAQFRTLSDECKQFVRDEMNMSLLKSGLEWQQNMTPEGTPAELRIATVMPLDGLAYGPPFIGNLFTVKSEHLLVRTLLEVYIRRAAIGKCPE